MHSAGLLLFLIVSSRGVASVIIMASEMHYVDGIPVVPKHTAMIDFLELCQSGATLKSVTLDSEMRKSSVDGSWAIIETEESGLSSREVVEKLRRQFSRTRRSTPTSFGRSSSRPTPSPSRRR